MTKTLTQKIPNTSELINAIADINAQIKTMQEARKARLTLFGLSPKHSSSEPTTPTKISKDNRSPVMRLSCLLQALDEQKQNQRPPAFSPTKRQTQSSTEKTSPYSSIGPAGPTKNF